MSQQEILKIVNGLNEVVCGLGRFVLGRKSLGQGGTSIVRRATFESGTIEYAIKFLLVDVSQKEPTEYKRFKQAYLNVCAAQHLGCFVPMIHFGVVDEGGAKIPYQVMAKMDSDLKAWKKNKGTLKFDEFEKIFQVLVRSVELIHRKGIIHRDIKPENIFVCGKRLLLGDFDIAKYDEAKNAVLAKTATGDRLGNRDFSAPEQSDKTLGAVCEASDWFAFGQLLYWLMRGRVVKSPMEISLSDTEPRFAKYDVLVRKLLQQKPTDRPANYDEIKVILDKEDESRQFWDEHKKDIDAVTAFDEVVRKYSIGARAESVVKLSGKDVDGILKDLSRQTSILNLAASYGSGDFDVKELAKEKFGEWLIGDCELSVNEIYVYRHSASGGHMLIIRSGALSPKVNSRKSAEDESYGLWNGHLISVDDYRDGWTVVNGRRCRVGATAVARTRWLKSRLLFLSPQISPILVRENDDVIRGVCDQYMKTQKISVKMLMSSLCHKIRRAQKIRLWD